jgi:hypothetical protein
MLTGQDMWRLEEGSNLWGTLPARFPVYPDMLEDAGYLVGYAGKGWGPGDYEAGGRSRNPAGNHYDTFEEFYNERNGAQPFCYWFSSRDPHRPYRRDGGEKAGIDLSRVVVPPYLPDEPAVRSGVLPGARQESRTESGGHPGLGARRALQLRRTVRVGDPSCQTRGGLP